MRRHVCTRYFRWARRCSGHLAPTVIQSPRHADDTWSIFHVGAWAPRVTCLQLERGRAGRTLMQSQQQFVRSGLRGFRESQRLDEGGRVKLILPTPGQVLQKSVLSRQHCGGARAGLSPGVAAEHWKGGESPLRCAMSSADWISKTSCPQTQDTSLILFHGDDELR